MSFGHIVLKRNQLKAYYIATACYYKVRHGTLVYNLSPGIFLMSHFIALLLWHIVLSLHSNRHTFSPKTVIYCY